MGPSCYGWTCLKIVDIQLTHKVTSLLRVSRLRPQMNQNMTALQQPTLTLCLLSSETVTQQYWPTWKSSLSKLKGLSYGVLSEYVGCMGIAHVNKRSRWLDIGQVLFCIFVNWDAIIHISSHFEWTSFAVSEGWSQTGKITPSYQLGVTTLTEQWRTSLAVSEGWS